MNFQSYLDKLQRPTPPPPPSTDPDVRSTPLAPEPPDTIEIVVDKRTGAIRQAGADGASAFIADFKRHAESSLYYFAKAVLGRHYLTDTLHKPLCASLQTVPPRRKLRLYPREHGKTSIVGQALPLHLLIQPKDRNPYFAGMDGRDTRILLSGETEKLASRNLGVIQGVAESNPIFRALWPHCVWDKPPRHVAWNALELVFPRDTIHPESTVTARGVGGAITGMHPNCLIKDDLISLEARNSEAVMQTAIEWHVASRGLIEGNDSALEFIIGTRWAMWDLYAYIIERDPLMDKDVRAAIEEGVVIYPESFTLDKLDRIRKDMGILYPLLYLNTAVGAGVTDFDMADVRTYDIQGRAIVFKEDTADLILSQRALPDAPAALPDQRPSSADLGHPGSRLAFLERRRYAPTEAA